MEAQQSPSPKSTNKARRHLRLGKRQSWIVFGAMTAVLMTVSGAVYGMSALLKVDPFKNLRPGVSNEPFDVNLGKFKMKAYEGQKEVASANVNSGRMEKGTRTLTMQGVNDAQLTTDDGSKASLTTPLATYDMNTKGLIAPMEVQLKTKDAQLKTQGLTYDQNTKTVTTGALTGKIGDGVVTGQTMKMNLDTNETRISKGTFQGKADVTPQSTDGGSAKSPTSWKIQAEETVTQGNIYNYTTVKAVSDDTILYAEKVQWDKTNNVLVATGNVRYYGLDADMLCDKATIKRKEKLAIFEGSVTMLVKPDDQKVLKEEVLTKLAARKPDEVKSDRTLAPEGDPEKKNDDAVRDSGNLHNFPSVVRAEHIDYYYKKGERRAEIAGQPMARQDTTGGRWRMIWADTGHYDGEKDRLYMYSSGSDRNVRVKNSIGDDMQAVKADVSTKKDDDSLHAVDSKGVMTVLDDEDTPKSGGGSGK